MTIKITGDIGGNYVSVHPRFLSEGNGTIQLLGQGATVNIDEQHASGSVLITVGSRASIQIGYACVIGMLTAHSLAPGSRIIIGKNVCFNGFADISSHEPSTIDIGEQCLIASGLSMSSSDVHSIYDKKSGARLNSAKDIVVGERTWIGGRVTVLKGVKIGAESVVAIGSIVTKSFEDNCLIGGVPARLIRAGIEWRR